MSVKSLKLPYELEAARCDEVPLQLRRQSDILQYLSLRSLYGDFRAGRIDRKQAAYEKKRIHGAWITQHSIEDSAQCESHRLGERLETAANRYKDDPSIENADLFYAAVYNLRDDWRVEKGDGAK